MKTWLRRIGAGIGILVLIVLITPLIAIVAMQHDQVRSMVVDRILDNVNEDLAGTITIDGIGGSLIGHVRIEGLHIEDARGNHAAQIDEATVDFRLRPLLRGNIVIDDLIIDDGNAVARNYADDVLNWDLVIEPDPDPDEVFEWPIHVDEITVGDVDIAYLDETLEVEDDIEGLTSWREARIDDLDEASDARELRERWEQGFDTEALDALAGPRAPIALWMTDLGAEGSLRMQGHDLEAQVFGLRGQLHSEIFAQALSTSSSHLTVAMSQSTLTVDVDELQLDDWIDGEDLEMGMVLPSVSEEPTEKPFESLYVELGHLQAQSPLFSWAAPEVPVVAPIDVRARLSVDPSDLILVAQIDNQSAPEPVEISLLLDDYPEELPRYRAGVGAQSFRAGDWLDDPDLPEVTTNAIAYVEGRGFEPEDAAAELRLRLDDTTVDEYEAHLVYADLDFDGQRLEGRQLTALTPYFDLSADFEIGLDGQARLRAHTTAEERHAATQHPFSELRPERAEATLEFAASFDPDLVTGDDPAQALDTIDAEARWDVAGLDIEDISAASSDGHLSIEARRLAQYDSLTVAADYDVEASGRSFSFDDHHLSSIDLRDKGSITVAPLVDDPFEMLRKFENDATATVRNLRTPDLRLSRAKVTMDTSDPGLPAQSADIRLRADISELHTAEADIGSLQSGVDGKLHFRDRRSSLDAFEATANAQLRNISAQDADVESADLRLDDTRVSFSSGDFPIDSISTDLRAEASGLSAAGTQIETVEDLDTTVQLELQPGTDPLDMLRRFEFEAQTSIIGIEAPEQQARVKRIDLSADLEGASDAPAGVIDAEAVAISVAGEDFPEAGAEINLDGDYRRGSLSADLRRGPDQGYHLRSRFAFDEGYDAGELSALRFGTERIDWRSPRQSRIRWTGERIEADNFVLRSDDQRMGLEGYFHPRHSQDMEIEVDIDVDELIDGFYLEELAPPLEGAIEGSLQLAGTHRTPTVGSTLAIDDFYHAGVGPFSLDASVEFSDETLHLARLEMSAFDNELLEAAGRLPMTFDLDGDFEIFTERHSQLRLRLHEQHLRRFHRPFPVLNDFGVDGTARLYLDWAGTLDDPQIDLEGQLRDFQFRGEVGDDFIDVRDVTVRSEMNYTSVERGGAGLHLSTDAVWNDDEVFEFDVSSAFRLEDWLVPIADGDAASLEWDDEFLDLPFEVRLVMPSFELDRIPMESLEDLDGEIEIDAHLEGPLRDPQGHLDLVVDGFGWIAEIAGRTHRISNADLDLRLQVDDQALDIETMELVWRGQNISSAEGTIPLPISTLIAGEPLYDLPLDFRWTFHERQIRDFDVINFDLYGHMEGAIGAEIDFGGSLRAPELNARAGIYDTRMGDDSLGSVEIELSAEDDEVAVNGEVTREEIPVVTIDGAAPVLLDAVRLSQGQDWQLPGDIHLDVSSDQVEVGDIIPTHLVRQYVVDPEGLLSLDIAVGGDWETPTVGGAAELEDGAATLPEFARGFENIQARLELDADAFVLDHFELHDGPSSIEASGTITHDLFIPDEVELSAVADDFNLVGIATDFPVFASAEVDVEGQIIGDPGQLRVDVYDLEVMLTDEWDRTLHATALDPDIIILDAEHRARLAEMADDEGDEIDGLHLTVDIVVHRPALGRHPAGDVRFDADLTAEIIGTTVTIGGSVDIRSGDLEFLGRRFILQSSEITFTGEIPPNPRLNIEAHYELERVIVDALGPPTTGEPRIEFQVTGTAMEPRLQLEADPAMTDTEILFVLMTGRPPDRTDVGRDEGVAAQALSAVSGVFFGLLEDELAGNVPVDVLRLEPAAPGTRGGRVEVGRYLFPNLFFSWRHQFGADEDTAGNVFRLEYHFLPRWMLEGRYNDLNEGELNIFWDAF